MNNMQDKCRGSLIGGAIGDALGYPVEFVNSFEEIKTEYGDNGIVEYDMAYPWADEKFDKALFSDDTQMTLYTAEGLLEAERSGKPIVSIVLKIDSAAMRADGIILYLSNNGVWLTDFVDPKYISLIDS